MNKNNLGEITLSVYRKMRVAIVAMVICSAAIFSASPVYAEINLWPLLELTDKQQTVIYPFYVKDENFMMVFPLYYNVAEPSEHHVLWPIFKVSNNRLTRVAPLWFSEKEGEFTLFPFIWKSEDGMSTLIPPMRFGPQGELKALFPLFSEYSSPVNNNQTRDSFSVLWPLYSKEEVRSQSGDLVSRNRRWLIFSDSVDSSGKQSIRLLGIPVAERFT